MNTKRASTKLIVAGIVAVSAIIATLSTLTLIASLTAQEAASRPSRRQADDLSAAFRYAAKKVLPSVVTIRKSAAPVEEIEFQGRRQGRNPFEGTPFEDFFGNDPNFRRFSEGGPSTPRWSQPGMGTGVIIDPSGIVLTNRHVVEGNGEISVTLGDGREFIATKVLTDTRTDIAVVWIENGGTLEAATLGDSDQMEIGDWVLAAGNPLGLYESVTAGIISAKGRSLGTSMREDFLQTDAAINPGNSGGPLVNLDGEVIGINTAIASRTGGYQGYGFAIPSNLVRWVADQLIEKGVVERAFLGTVVGNVTQDIATQFDIAVGSGAFISSVFTDSPADKAGLEPGDVVQQFGDAEIRESSDLTRAVERVEAGGTVQMKILRDGQPMTLDVTVEAMPQDYGLAERNGRLPPSRPEQPAGNLGIEVAPLTDDVAEHLALRDAQGVVITSIAPGSPAAQFNLAPGMVIALVNRQPVGSVEEFNAAMNENSSERDSVLLLVRTEEGSRLIVIRTEGRSPSPR